MHPAPRSLPPLTLTAALALTLAACGGDDAPADGGVDSDGGAPMMCGAPDTVCPTDAPLAGAPCEGALSCEYIHPDSGATMPDWTFACTAGAWEIIRLDCLGCAPALAERCRDPFTGTLDGATFAIGPAGDGVFVPFEMGARSTPIFGGQGIAMVELRVKIDRINAPACMTLRVQTSLEGDDGEQAVMPVKMRCGETLRLFAILPSNPCEFRDYLTRVTVEVDGIGVRDVNLVLEGGSCPRTL